MAIKNTINEGSSAFLTITFKDQTGTGVTPTTAAYRLDNAGAQVKDWESFTPSSSSYIIEITGAENAILNPELATETMTATLRWTYGTGSTGSESFEYVIKNLRCSP